MNGRLTLGFLGASRLVDLLSRFHRAAAREGISLEIVSVEDGSPWHAVGLAGKATIECGPRFDAAAFPAYLSELVERRSIDVVLSPIDAGVRALAECRELLEPRGVTVVASRKDVCDAMLDKAAAEVWFREAGVPTPPVDGWPRLAKPRRGSASRGQTVLHDEQDEILWGSRCRAEEYFVQRRLEGREFSVDAYVERGGRCLGAVARERVVVSGGEVMASRTAHEAEVIALADRILEQPGWYGPLNIQILSTSEGCFALEVNPRCGSGVTLAMEVGLDVAGWLMRERLGRSLPQERLTWPADVWLVRARKDYFAWSS